ncbi:MAG: retropepsin-like aspartic protease family protein [Alphaproteobacteria bacterium]
MKQKHIYLILVVIGLGGLVWYLHSLYPHALGNKDNRIQLVALVALGAVFISSLFSGRMPFSEVIRGAGAWVLLALILVLGYGYKDELKQALLPSSPHEDVKGQLQFTKASDGHFHIQARVNGTPVHFLLDTGATRVVLSQADAKRVGYDFDNLTFNLRSNTANGVVSGAAVVFDTFQVGSLMIRNLKASVNGGEMNKSLLGMEFLGQLDGYEVNGDTLTLRY